MFKWGDDWNSNRYYTLLSFLEITLFIFLCVALIYIFIYWFLNTQLQIALNKYKKTFQFTWSIIFGIGMSLLVNFNSFGFRTFFDFMKMFIIMGLIGWLIPFLDFKLKKYK
jgi:magnesium-transporting ATPase (P-type)